MPEAAQPPPPEIKVRLPGIALIKAHYKLGGLFDWKNDRVARLCNQINCTPNELCAAAGCFDTNWVRRWIRKNEWPVYMTISFMRLEDQVNRYKFRFERRNGPDVVDIIMAKLIAANLKPDARSEDN
jgi:hypothetical protein